MPPLLAVPNLSEGEDEARLELLQRAFTRGTRLLDRHTDADHGRSVFTLAGEPGPLTEALAAGAEQAIETIDMRGYGGAHPAVGALDVCPVVWFDPADRDAARTEAVAVAEQIGGLGVPVFLYGELAREPGRAERAYFRNGGLAELGLRMESGELRPDFGPDLPHPTAGATLVTARPPLAAFNVELDSGEIEIARSVAAGLREAGGGLAGVRAIGLLLSRGRAQVSTNVHDPLAVPLGKVVERVRTLAAPLGARPV
jgi:glutamate formiminotransferase / 5-formyltetrahydrofolate cyclo-ligase